MLSIKRINLAKHRLTKALDDYNDFYIADRDETKMLIESAKTFYDAIEDYLNTRFNESE